MVAMPTRNHIRVCTLPLIMGLGAACVFAKDNKKEAEALVAKAQELSNIRFDGCPAFRLWGRVRVFEASGKESAGLYAMTWVSQGQWGEDVEIPSVRQTRVRKGDKLWRYRNLPSPTLRLFQFLNAVDLHEELKSKADASVRKLRDRQEGSTRMMCVQAKARGGADIEFCFDTATGLLASTGNKALTQNYLDYAPFASKWYPRRIQLVVKGRPDMEISIEELVPLNPQEAISFEAPRVPVSSRPVILQFRQKF